MCCCFLPLEGFNMEEKHHLLNLNLSLVSHTNYAHVDQNKSSNNNNCDLACTYDDDHQGEILRLFGIRDHMLRLEKSTNRDERKNGAQMIRLLFKSATTIDDSSHSSSTISDLIKLYENASLIGDSSQRLAAYYADGLTARLLVKEKSRFFDMIMKEDSPSDQFLAFTYMYRVSPCYQFSHFTANQAILEAFEREEGYNNSQLHVVDFDLAYGLQWPSLIQSLSEKATPSNMISLRITGFASTQEEVIETETRLVSFAKGFRNVHFEFHGLLRGSKFIDHSLVRRRTRNETLVVNLVLSYLHTSKVSNVMKISDTLHSIYSLYPSIVVLVQREGGRNRIKSSVLAKFMESLHYYAAMFGSLDDCLPRNSIERQCIEKNHLGREMKSEILTGSEFGEDELMSWARYEGSERWRGRMEETGFNRIELSTRTTMQAKLLLRIRSHYQPQFEGDCGGGFRVLERENGKTLSLGWQDRVLITASVWKLAVLV